MKERGSLNRVYRVIWSHVLNAWVAVSEITKGKGKVSRTVALLALPAIAQASPIGGQVVSGIGTISQSGAVTTIHQSSQNLNLAWKSFNIAPTETVNFVQPSATAIAVNRIYDTNGSTILGHLNANGQVWLLNPNGILFGKSAQVNVGGLVASTLDNISTSGSKTSFSGSGSGKVENDGSISGRYVALLGNTLINNGNVSARLGAAVLGAGSSVTLTFSGNDLVSMQVDRGVLNALVANGGAILADGGRVILSSGARNDLLSSVVNNTGLIEARTVLNRNGVITLLGGMKAGTVNVGGTLDASAPNGGNGGYIETSGANVNMAHDARVTTLSSSGANGTWLIDPVDFTIAATGGNMTGAALSTSLAAGNVTIASTSGTSGTSGDVNVNDSVTWSANTLTLNAQNNINIDAALNGSGTAGLALQYGQGALAAGNTSNYYVNAAVNLPAGNNFSTKLGSDGATVSYTVITALGAQGSVTGTDLQGMNGNLAGNYALGANIDATATSGWNAGAGFTPVGNATTKFTGNFEGLGHTVNSLAINQAATSYVGLFGYSAGSLRDVGLLSSSILGNFIVGSLAGRSDGAIYNSYADGGSVSADINIAGGLVGTANGAVSYSHASVAVAGLNVGVASTAIGGLAGMTLSGGAVSDSYATGAVTGGNSVGGLIGQMGANVTNSYSTCKVTWTASGGGLIGFVFSGTVTNGYWNITTSGQGGSAAGTGLTTAQMQSASNFAGFTFTTTPGVAGWVMVDTNGTLNNAGGALGATFPMLATEYSATIQNSHQLQLMAMNLSGNYVFGQNIDAANTNTATGFNDVWSTTAGFVPVGNATTKFTGSLDGNNFTLNGLTINSPASSDVGLFGYLGTGAQVGNLGITGGSISGKTFVGEVAGYSLGTITNVYATGNVTGAAVNNGTTGGLVGQNSGTISNSDATGTVTGGGALGGIAGKNIGGTVTNSYATGNVTGTGNYVGGLVGNAFSGSVSGSHATGVVKGANWVGGLVGTSNTANITNSYATGNVTGGGNTGGLAGSNASSMSGDYATGTVHGGYNVGGLIGTNGGTLSSSYSTGNVTGTAVVNNGVGGLVGYNTAAISKSYSTGNVNGGSWTGGFTGYNSSALTDDYATGSATGTATGASSVGGVVGYNASTGTLNNTYASGNESGASGFTNNLGGIVGNNVGGTVSNSFWDTTVSSQASSSGGGVGMVTANMQKQADFSRATPANGNANPAWDFANTWVMYDGYTRPMLRNFMTNLTVTAQNAVKTYDGNAFVGGSVSYSATPNANLLGTLSYTGNSQNAVNAGNYIITPTGLYSNQQGYIITLVSGTLTVNKLALTGSIASGSSVYSAVLNPGAASFTNVVAGDNPVAVVSVNTTGNLSSSGNLKAGSYAGIESVSGLTGTGSSNYTFAGITGNYSVSKLTLSGSIAAGSSVYGSALTPGAATFTNAVSGDVLGTATVSVNTTGNLSSSGNLKAGSYAGIESVSAISGADSGNYTFSGITGNYSVSKLALTGSIAAGSSVYGSALTPGAATLSGVIPSDIVSPTAVTVNTAGNFSTSGNLKAGSYTESSTGLTGADSGNYSFAGINGTYSVTPLVLTITATGSGKTYDGTNTASASLSSTGLLAGDLVSFAGNAAFPDRNVGVARTVTVSGISATGVDSGNYSFNTTATTTADITPATLTYKSNPVSFFQGQAPVGLTGTVTGFVPGDNLANSTTGTLAWISNATSTSLPGQYSIDGSGLAAHNYVFVQDAANALELTVVAGAQQNSSILANQESSSTQAPDPSTTIQVSGPSAAGGTVPSGNVLIQTDSLGNVTDTKTTTTIGNQGPQLTIIGGGVNLPGNSIN